MTSIYGKRPFPIDECEDCDYRSEKFWREITPRVVRQESGEMACQRTYCGLEQLALVQLKKERENEAKASFYDKFIKLIFIGLFMNIGITKSNKKELREIAEIYVEEFSKPPYNENWNYQKAIGIINFYFDNIDLYSIKLGEELIGFAAVNPKFMCPGEVAYGEEITIKSEFQGKGYGKIVMEKIFDIYKNKGFLRFLCIVNKGSNSYKMFKKLNVKESSTDILIEKRLN